MLTEHDGDDGLPPGAAVPFVDVVVVPFRRDGVERGDAAGGSGALLFDMVHVFADGSWFSRMYVESLGSGRFGRVQAIFIIPSSTMENRFSTNSSL